MLSRISFNAASTVEYRRLALSTADSSFSIPAPTAPAPPNEGRAPLFEEPPVIAPVASTIEPSKVTILTPPMLRRATSID